MQKHAELTPVEKLKVQIQERFDDSLFAHAHWGVLIKSLKTGEVIYERNSGRMFNPASNDKILSAASALTVLGPEFTFETGLYTNGNISDSVLAGDLIVYGNGDPTLYSHFQKDPRDLFHSWAGMLKAKGIKKITGNIIGDDNAFDDNSLGYGWTFGDLDAYYSAEITSLQLNENYVDIKVIPPQVKGESIKFEPNIPSAYYTIVNNIVITDTGTADVSVSRPYGANQIIFSGFLPFGSKPFTESPALFNPTLYYTTVMKETFEADGIKVSGQAVDCDNLPGYKTALNALLLLDKHQSPPLSAVLKEMMKRSQNLYAETMPRILGFKEKGLGSFRNGKQVVERVLKNFGIEPGTYAYMDGSGLSRYDYVSPAQLVAILTNMRHSIYWPVWRDAQPVAGVDGTLRNRMKGTRAEGNVHAKTGTIANVRGLSGYVTTADGEEMVFSFLLNGHLRSSSENEKITDSVLDLLAGFRREEAGVISGIK